MDLIDIYMTIGCVSIPAAVAAYELGHPCIGTALCIASGACMLLAAQCWTSPDRSTKKNGADTLEGINADKIKPPLL